MRHSRKGASSWTPEMDETMRSMAAKGLSSTWIAAAVGRSRNAVIGRAKRIGVNLIFRSARGTGVVSPIARKPPPKTSWRQTAPKDRKVPQQDPDVIPDSQRVGIPLVELMSYSCRWPIHKDGEEARFCGEHSIHTLPYCWEHVRRAYLGRWF